MCSEGKNTGSGEGRGASEAKIRKGWQANDRITRDHRKGYGPKATPKERKRYWEGLFSRLGWRPAGC